MRLIKKVVTWLLDEPRDTYKAETKDRGGNNDRKWSTLHLPDQR